MWNTGNQEEIIMAFEKIELRCRDYAPDFDYLKEIEYVDIMGNKVEPIPSGYVKDNERNAYLIGLGMNNPNLEGNAYVWYVLCINGKTIGITVDEIREGSYWDSNYVQTWIIKGIKYPENWNPAECPDFKQILIDAFTAEAVYAINKPECVKDVKFIFDDTIEY